MGVFEATQPDGHEEIVFGQDPASGLTAIIAIYSTALGPSLGGTRFYPYPSDDDALADVLRLSKGMARKASAAGLNLGGGKAVIIGNPASDKSEALWHAYGRLIDSLSGRYITAEDVGTTVEDMHHIATQTRWVVGTARDEGGAGDPSPATALGLIHAMRAVATYLWGSDSLAGRRIAVQGVGKVGTALVEDLVERDCEVIVADIREDPVDDLVTRLGVKRADPGDILSTDCDILAPCSLGGSINEGTIPELACRAIVGSANNQLAHRDDADRLAERGILYGPDFVVNAGGLIDVAEEFTGYSVESVKRKLERLYDATLAILERARSEEITPNEAAIRLAEDRIRREGNSDRFRSFAAQG